MFLDLLFPRTGQFPIDRQHQLFIVQMFFEVTHRFIHDPRVPNAPATGSTKSIPPPVTFPKSPRSRGNANPPLEGASTVDRAPAALAQWPSIAIAAPPMPIAVPDSVADQPVPRQPSRRTRLDPAGSAHLFASSAPDYAPREKSTRANCPSAAPSADDETAPGKHFLHDLLAVRRPSTRSKARTGATGSDTHRKAG